MLFREEDEDLEVLPFVDRAEAGRVLASKLEAYSGRDDVIVLALPRGGAPVASVVAGVLHLPLDVLVVSKLGMPWNKSRRGHQRGRAGPVPGRLAVVSRLQPDQRRRCTVAAGPKCRFGTPRCLRSLNECPSGEEESLPCKGLRRSAPKALE